MSNALCAQETTTGLTIGFTPTHPSHLTPLFPIPHLRREIADIMLVQQVPQRSDLHLKQIGGFCLVAGGDAQGFEDIGFFEVFEMGGEVQAVVGQIEFRFYSFGVVVGDMVGQAFGLDLFAAFEGDGALDGMLQLADVSAPHIIFQHCHGLRRNGQLAAALVAEFAYKMLDKLGNVFAAVA